MTVRVVDHHGVLHRTPLLGWETVCWENGAPRGCTRGDKPGETAYGNQPDPPHNGRCPVCFPREEPTT